MSENNQIFRQKSIDRMKSPESLNDYVRVTNPGVWLLLSAVIVLLLGACLWGTFGYVDVVVTGTAIITDKSVSCVVSEGEIRQGMTMEIDHVKCPVDAVEFDPELGGRVIHSTANLPDGVYNAKIVTERLRPFSFVTN